MSFAPSGISNAVAGLPVSRNRQRFAENEALWVKVNRAIGTSFPQQCVADSTSSRSKTAADLALLIHSLGTTTDKAGRGELDGRLRCTTPKNRACLEVEGLASSPADLARARRCIRFAKLIAFRMKVNRTFGRPVP